MLSRGLYTAAFLDAHFLSLSKLLFIMGVLIMKRNIKLSYIYNFFMYFDITSAIWVLYLSFKGMSLVEIGLLESIYHVVSILCEIPTGAIADIYGRKVTIIADRISSIISAVLMIFSGSFAGFALAFAFSALSYNLNSGAYDALIYDSLKFMGRDHEFTRIYGTAYFISEISSAAAVLLGGILSDVRFIYAYIVVILVQTLAIIIAALFEETNIKNTEYQQDSLNPLDSLVSQMKESIKILRHTKIIIYLIVFFALISTVDTTVYFYSQKYFDSMKLSRAIIACIFTATNILSAVGAKNSHWLSDRFKKFKLLSMFAFIDLSVLLGMAFIKGYVSIAVFLLISIVRGIVDPVITGYVNVLIPSEFRATLLSFSSLCFSACMVFLFPLVGLLGDKAGLRISYLVTALVMIPVIIYMIYKIKVYEADTK